nr:hypothetical protein Iba_chr11bCG13810 [Ipomoea batatas]
MFKPTGEMADRPLPSTCAAATLRKGNLRRVDRCLAPPSKLPFITGRGAPSSSEMGVRSFTVDGEGRGLTSFCFTFHVDGDASTELCPRRCTACQEGGELHIAAEVTRWKATAVV